VNEAAGAAAPTPFRFGEWLSSWSVQAHEIPGIDPQPRDADGHGYIDFLASEKLSVGLAVWPASSTDRQQPHEEDEVYYVIAGRGAIRVAGEDREVRAGSLVFVAAHVEHNFRDIEEDLRVLVFWAPPHKRS
jgi:mannose-6-phosphate isomerase-like protein (cupin superfamily)